MSILEIIKKFIGVNQYRTSSHKAQSGNVVIGLVVIIAIVGIVSLVSGDDKPDEPAVKTPSVHIQDTEDNEIHTQERDYTLNAIIDDSSYASIDINGTLNEKPVSLTKDYGQSVESKKEHYTARLSLLPGKNSFSISVHGKESLGDKHPKKIKKEIDIHLVATEKPILEIEKATSDGTNWQINDYTSDTYKLIVKTIPQNSKNSGASTLQINDRLLKANDASAIYTDEIKSLKDGANVFTIISKNEIGEVRATLTINKLSLSEVQARESLRSALLEAEVSCKQYAEKLFLVKDINIGYDNSSLKRQNPDGSLLIKATIADSQGFFRQQKPLGIMECTTDSTGMLILNFVNY